MGCSAKYWTVKIFSKEDNQDIIISGRTVYKEPLKREPNDPFCCIEFLFISILLFAISFILLSLSKKQKGLKRNVNIVVAIILILFGLSKG